MDVKHQICNPLENKFKYWKSTWGRSHNYFVNPLHLNQRPFATIGGADAKLVQLLYPCA